MLFGGVGVGVWCEQVLQLYEVALLTSSSMNYVISHYHGVQ